jgi:hypothetical protein
MVKVIFRLFGRSLLAALPAPSLDSLSVRLDPGWFSVGHQAVARRFLPVFFSSYGALDTTS